MVHIIVVLGCSSVLTGGNKKELGILSHCYGRLMKSVDVYNEIVDKKIVICSGHNGEASKMKNFLIKHGVNDIICEPFAENRKSVV